MSLPSNNEPSAFCNFSEKIVFGFRPFVLVLFTVVTVAMLYFASQLTVDAGFKKQIPREHEYMKTFEQYEEGFGGANRVLVGVFAATISLALASKASARVEAPSMAGA